MHPVFPRTSRLLPVFALAVAGALMLPQPAAAQAVPEPPLTQIPIDGTGLGLSGGVPAPDGGWIVLSRSEGTAHRSLWLLPARGGELIRLTDGGYVDGGAAWSPSGDRIFFTSNRPARGELGPRGEPGRFVMTLRIDPQTGRPVDAPRQVTLERESSAPAVSPDGRSVLYRTGNELRVVPAMGGNSQVIGTLPPASGQFTWAPDGNAVYYAGRDPATNENTLYRLATSGGTPTEIIRREITAIAPGAQRLAVVSLGPGPRQRTIEIIDFSGRTIARRVTDSSVQPVAFTADGRTLILGARDDGAIVRVRPVAGGEAIDLTDGSTYNWPGAWTADSRSVIVLGDVDGARILPLTGGTPRTVELTAEELRAGAFWWEATPTHVSFRVPNGEDRHRLVSIDIATGERTVLTENARILYGVSGMAGPGGLYRDVDGPYFTELADGNVVHKSAAPDRPTRTIHSTPLDSLRAASHAFQGDRVAYYGVVGDSVAIMIIDGQGAAPRVLATVGVPSTSNSRACCTGELNFSYDGSWILADLQAAVPAAVGSQPNVAEATFIRVPQQGRATEIRSVPVDAEFWYWSRWAPDNSGITAIAVAGNSGWVAFVPTAPGQAVRHLSKPDDQSAWGFSEISPDGRYVAYPAEVPRGRTLWRMDVR